MKKFNVIILMTFVGLTLNLNAQENEKKDRTRAPNDTTKAIMLAVDMVNYGYANQAPLLLLEATKIITNYPLGNLIVEKSEPSEGAEGNKTEKMHDLDPAKLLSDAKGMAIGDKNIIALIEKEEKVVNNKSSVASKGRVGGGVAVDRRVHANSRYTDYILFRGNELAEVAVLGDGDNDLDLYVYNENGELVGSDTDYTDRCYVSFYPYYTKSYKVVVINRGRSVYSDYILMCN